VCDCETTTTDVKDEVAAFEELIGGHGGLGGTQSEHFILHPIEWDLENEEIIGAENVCRLFKRRLLILNQSNEHLERDNSSK
jgi:hypothetical protein